MKLTIGDILAAATGLQGIASQKIAAVEAFEVAQMITAIAPILNSASRARLAALQQHGVEKAPGEWMPPDSGEKRDSYMAEMEPLLAKEVEIDFKPIPRSTFLSLLAKAPEMTAGEVMALAPFHD